MSTDAIGSVSSASQVSRLSEQIAQVKDDAKPSDKNTLGAVPDTYHYSYTSDATGASAAAPTQTPSHAPTVNPVSDQAPAAGTLIGIPAYTLYGHLEQVKPGSGQSLNVSV